MKLNKKLIFFIVVRQRVKTKIKCGSHVVHQMSVLHKTCFSRSDWKLLIPEVEEGEVKEKQTISHAELVFVVVGILQKYGLWAADKNLKCVSLCVFLHSSSGVIYQTFHNWVPIMWAIRRRHYEVNKKWIELQQRGCVRGEVIRQLLPAADGGWSREPGAACVKLCRWHSADGATPLQACWSSSALTCWCLCFSTLMWNIRIGGHINNWKSTFFLYLSVLSICFDVFNIQIPATDEKNSSFVSFKLKLIKLNIILNILQN